LAYYNIFNGFRCPGAKSEALPVLIWPGANALAGSWPPPIVPPVPDSVPGADSFAQPLQLPVGAKACLIIIVFTESAIIIDSVAAIIRRKVVTLYIN
jgi:hypothetical protein